jgi:hypothetical protein
MTMLKGVKSVLGETDARQFFKVRQWHQIYLLEEPPRATSFTHHLLPKKQLHHHLKQTPNVLPK